MKGAFPGKLEKKATLMGALTRIDLAVLGGCMIATNAAGFDGLPAMATAGAVLFAVRTAGKRSPRGFFSRLNGARVLSWRGKLKEAKGRGGRR